MSPRTVYGALALAAARYGHLPALHQPVTDNGVRKYNTYSWTEYCVAVEELAAGLRQLGLRKGDIIALNSETRAEFYIADLGVMAAGCVSAALYPTYPLPDLIRRIRAADARAVFVEDPKTFAAFRAAADSPHVLWFLLTGEAEGAVSLRQLRELGRQALGRDKDLRRRLGDEVTPEDHGILYLTSGATGEPKMVLVSNGALVANMEMILGLASATTRDSLLAFLPSAHIAQRIVVELIPLHLGCPVWFSESLKRLPEEIRRIRPTVFLAPPRLWERVYTSVCTEIRKQPPYAQKMYYVSLGLALEAARLRHEGNTPPRWMRASLAVADRLVFRKLRARLGGRMRIPASGAAPLGRSLAQFYEAIGMPLIEGYGLTEGGVVCFNPIDKPRAGSIGKLLPGAEARFAADGELLVRAPCMSSGYYKDPEATREIIGDGWLRTGDLGEMDPDGYIYITGRKKELIVSSNGKKIFPSRIESFFKMEPIVNNMLLLGDGMPHVAALFTVNATVAETLDGMREWQGRPAGEIATAPPVVAELHQAVQRVNQQLAPFEQIRRYRILPRDFTIEDGELTATMKVRRDRVLENFRETVSELCQGREDAD
jgi:long-chain acyl-CoA synthetase